MLYTALFTEYTVYIVYTSYTVYTQTVMTTRAQAVLKKNVN